MPRVSHPPIQYHAVPDIKTLPRPMYIRLECFAANSTVKPHAHTWGQLTYSLTGIMRIETTQGNFIIPPQYALWIPAGIVHTAFMLSKTEFRSLYVEQPFLTQFPNRCVVYEVSPMVREMIKHLSDSPDKYDETGADGRLVNVLLDQILRLPETPLHLPIPRNSKLQVIVNCLLENPSDKRTLNDWAAELQTSTRTLARWFKQDIGMGFRQWRQRALYLAALQYLEQGTSTTRTAMELGYDSVSAFITMFKKTCGISPGEYLRKHK